MSIVAWEKDFPSGYGHTSIAYLRRCPGYEDAKRGDLDAARFVVSRCIKCNRIQDLRKRYPEARLIPVTGRNQLPLALAKAIGMPILDSVRMLKDAPRKSMRAIERLIHKPIFTGSVQKGISYILVDDVVTQGGTIAALRRFITMRGGKVVAVVALAYAIGSHDVAPSKRVVVRLKVKFGFPLILLLRALELVAVVWELTNSQVKYLLRFASVGNIIKRLPHKKLSAVAL